MVPPLRSAHFWEEDGPAGKTRRNDAVNDVRGNPVTASGPLPVALSTMPWRHIWGSARTPATD